MKITFIISIFIIFQNCLLYSACKNGFIKIIGKVLDQDANPINNVKIIGFINNSSNIYYSKIYSNDNEKSSPAFIEKEEDTYAKSKPDGSFELKLYINLWSWEEGMGIPHCDERIIRIDVIFLKDGYFPTRRVILPIKEGIFIDYKKPIERVVIDIGEVKILNIKEGIERTYEIIYGVKRKKK